MPAPITEFGVLTAVQFIMMAVLAIVTVAGIVWGIRLSRQRNQAEQIEQERVEADQEALDEAEASAPRSPPKPAPTPPAARAPAPAPSAPAPAPPPPRAEEPVAAAAPFDAPRAVEASSPTEPAPIEGPSPTDGPITQLKGLGPKVAARLEELGITTVGQLAALDDAAAAALDAHLGPFTGRMARDRWIEQARLLAAGNNKGFEAVFGRL